MSILDKILYTLRTLFSSGQTAYDERRHLRLLVLTIIVGIILAVGFGFALYHLNTGARFDH